MPESDEVTVTMTNMADTTGKARRLMAMFGAATEEVSRFAVKFTTTRVLPIYRTGHLWQYPNRAAHAAALRLDRQRRRVRRRAGVDVYTEWPVTYFLPAGRIYGKRGQWPDRVEIDGPWPEET